jgi:methanogenic corrinoid protein MtbC1
MDLSDPYILRLQLCKALYQGDSVMVRSLIHGAYQNGYAIETLADRIICPAMHDIGHQWEKGEIDILKEHRATQDVVSALYQLKGQISEQGNQPRPVAVGGAPEDDHYILASLLAKMTLQAGGWDAINLGPHTPFSAFQKTLIELKPTLVWISISHLADPEKFISEYVEFHKASARAGVAIALGGRGLTPEIVARLPCELHGENFARLATFAKSLFQLPMNPKRGRPCQV